MRTGRPESGRGLPHSKTLRRWAGVQSRVSVLELDKAIKRLDGMGGGGGGKKVAARDTQSGGREGGEYTLDE